MRFLVYLLFLSFFLSACQSPSPGPAKTNEPAERILIKIERMEDIGNLEKGNLITFTPAMKKWLNLFSPDAAFTEDEKKVTTLKSTRSLLGKLRGVFLRDDPVLRIERDPDKSGLIIRFKLHRDFECHTSAIAPDIEDAVLESSDVKGSVLFSFKIDRFDRCIEGLLLESLTLKNNKGETIAKVSRKNINIKPDTRLAYQVYHEGLKLPEDKMPLKAVGNFVTAIKCDKEASAIKNHLAWFLIDPENKHLKHSRPKKGLELALSALKSARKYSNGYLPDILDTVAWAYFKIGNIEKAIETQEEALKFDSNNRAMLRTLETFKEALKNLNLKKDKTGKKKENNVEQ